MSVTLSPTQHQVVVNPSTSVVTVTAPGPVGPQGGAGAQGATGATGAQGPAGADGVITSVAVTGTDGVQVDSGSPITTSSGTITLGINKSTLLSHINVADGAEVNVNADWNASSGDAQIQNKPTIPSGNQIIDWTASGAGTIHASNYTDTNTTYSVQDGELSQNNFTNTLKTKLDNIEASADVTDATNVASAGAVMESDTSTSSMGFVIDDDTMGTASSTKLATSESIKAYVDSSTVGLLDYKGGYNAGTNSPDLDTDPSTVKKGDVYAVTHTGTFFSTALEVGDVLIAEQDDPDEEANWTVVNKDLNAGSIKTLYESNSNTNAFTDALQTKLNGVQSNAIAEGTAIALAIAL